MLNIHQKRIISQRRMAWITALCLCFCAAFALADGVMPVMPPPQDVPLYWQLESVEMTPEVRAAGGYNVSYEVSGLSLDLDDPLMAESLIEGGDASQGITLTIEKGGETVMEHVYDWTPMPIYMEPKTTYPVEVSGTGVVGQNTPNSLLGIYVQGELVSRISAGGYTGHADSASFEVSTTDGVYTDGSLVVSYILRDVNDMFRLRIVYSYTMNDGVKPQPTPVPGFVAVEIPENVLPDHYVQNNGREDVWTIVTEPEEYRAYGSMSGSEPGFFPADKDGNVVMNERPADPQKDFDSYVKGFVAEEPETIPEHYKAIGDGLYSFTTRDGETVTRAFGRVDGQEPSFYSVDEEGNVSDAAVPVDPQADYTDHIEGFGVAEPEASVPPHYSEVDEGLYSFDSRDGETHYRAYGRLHGEEPAYYPADKDGNVAADAKPAAPQDDFDCHIKGFDATAPEQLPTHYEAIEENLFAVEDHNGEKVYRVFGVKDGQEPAFYPADETGAIAEDAVPVNPQDDFDRHVAGFASQAMPDTEIPPFYKPTEQDGVWAYEDKDGNTHYRTFGSLHRGESALYPSDAKGNVDYSALPVDPASELAQLPAPEFAPEVPQTVPAHYSTVEGMDGVYSITGLDGEKIYRVYGAYGDSAPQFYPADEQGNIVEYADAVDPDVDYAERLDGFTPQPTPDIPTHYEVADDVENLYTFTGKNHKPVYRVYGAIAEDAEPAFYPADAQGRIISGTPVDPEADADLQPVPVVAAVITPSPEPAPETIATPLVRVRNGDDKWTDPNAPKSTAYVTDVVATNAPSEAADTVTRQVTAPAAAVLEPEATETAPEETAKAEETPVVTEAATAAQTEAAPVEEPSAEPSAVPEEKQGGLSQGAWIAIIIGALAVVGGGGYAISKNRKKK